MKKFTVTISSLVPPYHPLPLALRSELAEGWEISSQISGDRNPLANALAKVAAIAGISKNPILQNQAWNQTLDWLDTHHPTWRGTSVAVVQRGAIETAVNKIIKAAQRNGGKINTAGIAVLFPSATRQEVTQHAERMVRWGMIARTEERGCYQLTPKGMGMVKQKAS